MTVGIHVVRVGFFAVDANGNYVDKNNPSTTAKSTFITSHEHLVIPDSAVPNSTGRPTVKAYLELEAASDYVLNHMSQTMIVTYDAGDINGLS